MIAMSHTTWLMVHAALESAAANFWFDDAELLERSHNALRWASGHFSAGGPYRSSAYLIIELTNAVDRAMWRCTEHDVSIEGIDSLVHLAVHLKAARERVKTEASV